MEIYKKEIEWYCGKNTLKILSVEGKWHKILKSTKEDRLYFIQIDNSEPFPIKHEQQLKLIDLVLMNDIIYNTFLGNLNKFETKLIQIKNNWEKENGRA